MAEAQLHEQFETQFDLAPTHGRGNPEPLSQTDIPYPNRTLLTPPSFVNSASRCNNV